MNKRLLWCLALAVCVISVSARAGGFSKAQDFRPATPEELAMKTAPNDAGADAVILDWVRVDDDTVSVSSEYYRIKILTEEGKKRAEIELPYVPGYPLYGKVTDLSARTIRPDGTIVPFDGKVYDKVLYKARRNSVRAKTFTFADVQPGSIIEYRYILRWTEGYIGNTYWPLQRDIPLTHAKLQLQPANTEGQYGSFFTYFGLPPGVVPKRNKNVYDLEVSNIPALRKEAFMPPEEQLRARVNFYYTDSRVTLENFWPNQTRVFAEEIEKFIAKGGKAEAQRLSAGETDRMALLQKLYAHIQSLRNLSYEDEKSEQEIKRERIKEARNAEDVLKKGSGFRTELNRAFVALARSAGFEADAVRVAPRDEYFFSDKLPDASQMSGEIAVVTEGDRKIYLDPGTRHAPFGVVSWEKTAVPAIQVAKGGKTTWLRLGTTPASEATTRRNADLRIEGENLEGTITVTFTGQEALVRRVAGVTDDEAARRKMFEDEVKKWFPDGATLKLTSLTGHDTFAGDVTAKFDVTLPNLVSSAGSRMVVPISVFTTQSKNPFAPATRTHPIYFAYPNSEIDEVKLTVPANMTVATLPKPEKLDGGALGYQAETKRQEGVITYTRSTNVGVSLIDPKHYPALRNFYSAVTTADQQPLVLVPAAGGGK
jgi:Domain of Unknown Function with PDB structure (DUF3857)/Transglutaminase-like superfamily